MRDEVDHLALPLNAATYSDHAGAHLGAATSRTLAARPPGWIRKLQKHAEFPGEEY
jgi:hypothetical protein